MSWGLLCRHGEEFAERAYKKSLILKQVARTLRYLQRDNLVVCFDSWYSNAHAGEYGWYGAG